MISKRIGPILILCALAALLISPLFAKGYTPGYGLLVNLESMEFVLRENKIVKPVWSPSTHGMLARSLLGEDIDKKEPDEDRRKRETESQKKYEKQWEEYWTGEVRRIAIPYKYFLALDIITIFTGLGLLIVPKKQQS